MISINEQLSILISKAIEEIYNVKIEPQKLLIQQTNPEFEGDLTLNVFPLLKSLNQPGASKKPGNPEALANEIGNYVKLNATDVSSFNVIKGFLNFVVSDVYWIQFFSSIEKVENFGLSKADQNSKTIMVEYSSPNTNKPLHLGHIRNNLLGYAVAEILKANGNKVIKANLVNDRGIHICKSMLAHKNWGKGETPESTGMKGDHLVGKYYVEFDKQFKVQSSKLKTEGLSDDEAEKKAPVMLEIQDMLRKWEAGDKETIDLWKMMNGWVYKGFEETYKTLGVDFDKMYYESNTYLLGKKIVEEGLEKKVLFKKEDGSVWIDLTADGLDQKVLLRSDGTSVYMTQDLGTAVERFKEFPQLSQLIYTVGNEQDYHFKVLFLVLKKLGYQWAEECYHLSYGMVELPDGKMKSREGTVVDADELIKTMIDTARETTQALGKIENFSNEEAEALYRKIALGALKYFMIKVDPKKKMLFNPKESIDFNGNTGPFIQYTFTRIRSILRKAEANTVKWNNSISINAKEKELIKLLYHFKGIINESAKTYNPAHLANYAYELAKTYNQFYHETNILKEENTDLRNSRLALSEKVANTIQLSMKLLGIEVPERM